MNIKSGLFYWPTTYSASESNHVEFGPLEENIECDYVIVGSGESGAQSAYFLSETGARIVVVDKRKIAHGSTFANTGLLQYTSDKPLHTCIHSFGKEKAIRFYQLCIDAVNGIEQIASLLDINPNFIKRKSLYYASDQDGVELLKAEYQALKENGFPVEALSKAEIKKRFGFEKEYALYTGNDAEVNPYKLVNGILQLVYKKNVKIYGETDVKSIFGTNSGVQLVTHNHFTIKAKKVIFAGGYESLEVKNEKNAFLSSTYAIATEPCLDNDGWFENSLIWETARPYLFMRTTIDRRIIVGGLDEYTTNTVQRDSMLIHKKEQLLEKLIDLFPRYKGVKAEYYWTGVFGETHSGLPMIRQYQEFPNCFFLMGYGGSGTIYSYILANILKDLVTIGFHPDAHLFMNHQ